MCSNSLKAVAVPVLLTAFALAACQREERDFRSKSMTDETEEQVSLVPLSPGPSGPVEQRSGTAKKYEENAYQIAQGQRLYAWFNCNGCHGNGGGGSGPALMDDTWIYGGQIENIVQSIREGRPNGMPSFRGKVPDEQIWEIAAYVRSMGRNVPKAAAPGRRDDMSSGPAEQRRPPGQVIDGGQTPPSAQMPQ
ncbi:c-type cytochrome [Microvirga mediterraneensis]|uniref:C-type cytochrome n=1 Tax=Microvirga mediterraneensis TaxID=2754695 RepID=A0A838BMC7_9HYPH|nr:c-type cytochrome [Microvirga mediterraneensis]MBA1155626.1 c-type cytochrome [Microvirga mediterraneensis]